MANRRRRAQRTRQADKAPMGRNLEGRSMSSTEVLATAFALGQAQAATSTLNSTGVPGNIGAVPLPRDTYPYLFGPGIPSPPAPLDPPRRDTGRPEPRISEYDISWNLPDSGNRHHLVPWKTLRDAADNIPLLRRCIEIRKAETVSAEWEIALTKRAVQTAQRITPSKPRHLVEADLRERLDPEIDKLTAFWQMPDRGNGYTFAEWLGQFLEEHFVLDAVAIYPRYTYGGDLFSLEVLDGSTIKPLLDERGGRPTTPHPAYQQILRGFPRGEFTADTATSPDGSTIAGGYAADQLIYIRRVVRTWTPYGYSAVEQALRDGDLYMRRYNWLKSEYTEGVMPSGWLQHSLGAGQNNWSPQQLLEYERDFNDFYSGSTANRRRYRILPPGLEPASESDVAERYKPEYDMHLIKLLVSHFDTSIAELGFTEAKGLGGASYHDGQAAADQRKGTIPMLRWLMSIITDISRQHLQMSPELEFRWPDLASDDDVDANTIADAQVKGGRITLNEDRDRLGLPRYEFPEADMPMVQTLGGLVYLNGASKLAPAGEPVRPVLSLPPRDVDLDGILDPPHGPDPQVTANSRITGTAPQTDTGRSPTARTPARPPTAAAMAAAAATPATTGAATAKAAELAALRRWIRKNPSPRREFTCAHLTKADAPELATDQRIVFADPTPGGDSGGPKVGDSPAATWPGWDHDGPAAEAWQERLQQAAAQGIDPQTLAERWLSHQPTTINDNPGALAVLATAWLTAQAATTLAALTPVIAGIWTEGWALGTAAAAALLTGRDHLTPPWRPGDTTTALQTLTPEQRNALTAALRTLPARVQDIAERRRQALAQLLATHRGTRSDSLRLAQAIRALLADPAWARRLALTELTTAQAHAAAHVYQAAGITTWHWAAEPDACPVCLDNQSAGPRPLGEPWPDGSTTPPAHPHCRCAALPTA